MKYNALTLDFWDTIATYPFNDDIFMERVEYAFGVFKEYNISFEKSIILMKGIYEHFEELWNNKSITPTTADMFRHIETTAGIRFAIEHFERLVEYNENLTTKKYFKIGPETVSSIKELSTKYKIVIISDTGFEPGRVIKKVIEDIGLYDCFTGFVFSDEAGFSKPDIRAFKKASEITDEPLEKMIHVGDRENKDIKGARNSGMGSILFTGFRSDDKEITTADHVAASWDEIKEILL